MTPGICGSFQPFEAFFELHHHHFDCNDRIINKESECDHERAQRNPVEDATGEEHDDKHRSER